MSTLYREYRPKNFKELVGQNHIKITLQHQLESNNITHAYLFCGARGIGKTTVARVMAKAANCLNRKEGKYEPCNECSSCQDINSGRSIDMIEIDAASNTGVDNVRENIIANARVAPSTSKYKVFIIDEVHMLSISAFNALLKILEEPPQSVIFILCTTEVHKIPATIISRCQRFDFKRISVGDIVKKLIYIIDKEEIKIDRKILEAIARHSGGHMRDAESLLGQVVAIGGKKITQKEADLVIPRSDLEEVIKLIDFLLTRNAAAGIELINNALNDGIDLVRFATDFIELMRKILITKVNPSLSEKLALDFGQDIEIRINDICKRFSIMEIIKIIERFIKASKELKDNFIVQLPLEMAVIELCEQSLKADMFVQRNLPKNTPQTLNENINNSLTNETNNKVLEGKNKTIEQNINLNIRDIEDKWREFLAKIKTHNHSLSFILRVCRPQKIDGQDIYLAFRYKFHKERMDDVNIKKTVEQALAEVYGTTLRVVGMVDENLQVKKDEEFDKPQKANNDKNQKSVVDHKTKTNQKGNNDMMSKLLKTFGGEIVQ